MRNAVLGPVSDTCASTTLPVVCTTTGTSTANGAPGCVCADRALDDVGAWPRLDRLRASAFGQFGVRRLITSAVTDSDGRARPFDPVGEEPAEILAAHRLHRPAHVVERGALALEVAIEAGQELAEVLVADGAAQRVEAHHRASVADRLGRRAVAAAELHEREVLRRRHVVAVLLQRRAAVLGVLAALLLHQVIGEVGGEPLAPVARASSTNTELPHQLCRISCG